jgi:hypothetical protein
MSRKSLSQEKIITFLIFGIIINGAILIILSKLAWTYVERGQSQTVVAYSFTETPVKKQPTNIPATLVVPSIQPGETNDIEVTENTMEVQLMPADWQNWAVLPQVSNKMKEIYRQGVVKGNNVRAFSVVGDCLSEPEVFLGIYDHPNLYQIDENNAPLKRTINRFAGSFSRQGEAVRNGLSAPSVLSPEWANPDHCLQEETPVDCELRSHRPVIVFVLLGTNWVPQVTGDRYEKYLTKIVQKIVQSGAVPILATKADNREGDHKVNLAIARVANKEEVPLWNFWRAVQEMPNGGLDENRDNIYLTEDAASLRRFSALQVLDSVWRQIK